SVFISLVSEDDSLDVYIDGALKKSLSGVSLRARDFAGTLILANAYDEKLSWRGVFRGLALFDHSLRPDEVSRDYRLSRGQGPVTQGALGAYSLFLFDQPVGNQVRNLGKAGPDLLVPKSYFVLQPAFLVPFWKEYRPGWEYQMDLAVHVAGLVPPGFCLAALLAWRTGRRRSLLYATLAGFLTSLTIEILQAFLPTRFSGTTDLITNTLGSALGAWLYLNRAT